MDANAHIFRTLVMDVIANVDEEADCPCQHLPSEASALINNG